MAEPAQPTIEISAANLDDLEALQAELQGRPGLKVEAPFEPGEVGTQGTVIEFLTVACSGGAITVLLQIIKSLVESRGSSFSLKIRRGRNRLEVRTDNVDDILPLLKELISGS